MMTFANGGCSKDMSSTEHTDKIFPDTISNSSSEEKMPEIGVRVCGGCNLQYDREDIVRRLPELIPEAKFVTARSGVRYAALLVMHGCPIACTSEFNLAVPEERRVRMDCDPEELPAVLEQLRKILGI